MSAQSKAALDAAIADPEFLKAVITIVQKNDGDEEHRHQVAIEFKKRGFDIDPDDLYETALGDPRFNHKQNSGLAEKSGAEVNAMSAEELEAVAGGEFFVGVAVAGTS
jgi:hypothetical protein